MKKELEVRSLGAGKFKATCLQLMDEVAEKNLTIVITKRGKPIAQLSAPSTPSEPSQSAMPKPAKKTKAPEPTPGPAAAPPPEKHGKKKNKGKKKKHK